MAYICINAKSQDKDEDYNFTIPGSVADLVKS